jgi:predicted SnoaL-like aldol condensation-catalyzing enzyme
MTELIDTNDSRAVRNKNNVLALYDQMINQKKSEEATARFVSPAYIQHNPLIADGPRALGQFFGKVTRERARARVVPLMFLQPAAGDMVNRGLKSPYGCGSKPRGRLVSSRRPTFRRRLRSWDSSVASGRACASMGQLPLTR